MRSLRLSAAALCVAVTASSVAPAFADDVIVVDHAAPAYRTWQHDWDHDGYDRDHVIVGRVRHFEPYRLTIRRRDGVVQTIDLKRGTQILPLGATPERTEFVAVLGYYSRGTFIANRVILRD